MRVKSSRMCRTYRNNVRMSCIARICDRSSIVAAVLELVKMRREPAKTPRVSLLRDHVIGGFDTNAEDHRQQISLQLFSRSIHRPLMILLLFSAVD